MNYVMDNKQVALMIWETNSDKRFKKNTQTNFRVQKGIELQVGDSVSVQQGDAKSVYTIAEIENVHPSSMKGFNYFRTQCSWRKE